jgi:hypothetical protein
LFGAENRFNQPKHRGLVLTCDSFVGADLRPSTHLALYCLGLSKAETQVTAEERACLLEHASGSKLGAEIGVWHGVTTSVVRSVMDPSGTLYAIDPFPSGRMGFTIQRWIASREIWKAKGAEVRFLRLTGVHAAQKFLADGVAILILFSSTAITASRV